MSTSAKRFGLDVKGDLELETRLRRIEHELEGKQSANQDATETTRARSNVPQVSGLRLTGSTPGSVTVAWNAVSIPDLRRYEIQFATNFGFSTDLQTFNQAGTQYVFSTASDTGGGGGATWFARVRAVNSFGQAGTYSAVLNLETGQAQTADLAPGSVTTVQITPAGVAADAVSYDHTSSGLTSTNVQDAIDELASGTPTPVFTESATTAQTAITLNGQTTMAHGLTGGAPSLINLMLVCVVNDASYVAGDIIYNVQGNYGTADRYITISADATNVYVYIATNNQLAVADKGGGGGGHVDLTTASWRFKAFVAR